MPSMQQSYRPGFEPMLAAPSVCEPASHPSTTTAQLNDPAQTGAFETNWILFTNVLQSSFNHIFRVRYNRTIERNLISNLGFYFALVRHAKRVFLLSASLVWLGYQPPTFATSDNPASVRSNQVIFLKQKSESRCDWPRGRVALVFNI